MRGPALQHGAPEQPCGTGHRQQRRDAHGAGRLTHDGDGVRVAAERRDVVAHPLQGRHLVEETEVRRRVGQERETLDAEPVVDRDGDHTVAGEGGAVHQRDRAGAVDEGPAVDPHEHRETRCAGVGGPYAQVEVVVAGDRRIRHEGVERRREARHRCRRAVRGRFTDAGPARRGIRGAETPVADGCGGVRDAEEGGDAVALQTPHVAARRGDGDRRRGGRGTHAARACRAGNRSRNAPSPACGQLPGVRRMWTTGDGSP